MSALFNITNLSRHSTEAVITDTPHVSDGECLVADRLANALRECERRSEARRARHGGCHPTPTDSTDIHIDPNSPRAPHFRHSIPIGMLLMMTLISAGCASNAESASNGILIRADDNTCWKLIIDTVEQSDGTRNVAVREVDC